MEKTCRQCSAGFVVTDEDLAFYDKVSPVFNGKKESIPPPTLCPECRLQRRLAFRNQIYVHLRTSSTTNASIFSMWPENTSFPVVSEEEWWGDQWDAMDYGRSFNFNRSFFEQFNELRNQVPHIGRSVTNLQNSDYCNNAGELKNCYLVFHTTSGEDGMYCEMMNGSKDCIDCTYIIQSELCYNCVWCQNCYNVQSSQECENCSDSYFLLNCKSCKHCYGCANLSQSEYCIFNEQKTKEDYEAFIAALPLSSRKGHTALMEQAFSFFYTLPRPHMVSNRVEQCTGNYFSEAREVVDSYFVTRSESVRHCFSINDVKDCADYSIWGDHAELIYECISCGINIQQMISCYECLESCYNLAYCYMSRGCSDCFGCVSLKKKQYCILNKQYTKEEYEELIPKIIEHMRSTGEWGEFFPLDLAPTPYNESLAQRYFPLNKTEAVHKNLQWNEEVLPEAAKAISPDTLPDDLPSADEAIIVRSSKSGRPFKITTEEIKRYRRLSIPLPYQTYDERMEERAQKLGGIRLYDRTCAKTGKPFKTTIPPDSPWIVWDREEWEREFRS